MAGWDIVNKLDMNSVLYPPVLSPEDAYDMHGSLHNCQILDTVSETITSDDVAKFIRAMNEDGHELEMRDAKINLICIDLSYQDNPEDIRNKFDIYIYLYRIMPDGIRCRMCVGFVYYYASLEDDGTYSVEQEYSFEMCMEEYHRQPGDYFKVENRINNDVVKKKFEVVDYGYPRLYDFQLND